MKNGKTGFQVTLRGCGCSSTRIEEGAESAPRLSRRILEFVLPLKARLFYDPQIVASDAVITALREQGCAVPVDRLQFGIPMRPLFSPEIWRSKVDRLAKELQGVLSASIDFGKCLITVDYMPALTRPNEIQNVLLGRKRSHEGTGNREDGQERSIDRARHPLKPGRISGDNAVRLSFVETSASQPCGCKDLDGIAA